MAMNEIREGLKTPMMFIRERVFELEEELKQMKNETDCTAQTSLVFQIANKFDGLKAFIQEKEAECEAGKLSRQEYEAYNSEYRRVRAWVSSSIAPFFEPFFQEYTFRVANSHQLMEQVFTLRHEVYCQELGYEPLKTDKKESDEYDPLSVHVLLSRNDEPNRGVGCVRVVLLPPTSIKGLPTDQLPLSRLCKNFYSHDPLLKDRRNVCEISRLSLLAEFRTNRITAPIKRLVALALPIAAYVVTLHNNIHYAYQLCEVPLVKYLSKSLGTALSPIGEPVEFHGTRVPTIVHTPSSVEAMDLIPFTFYHLLKTHLYGPPPGVPNQNTLSFVPVRAKI